MVDVGGLTAGQTKRGGLVKQVKFWVCVTWTEILLQIDNRVYVHIYEFSQKGNIRVEKFWIR